MNGGSAHPRFRDRACGWGGGNTSEDVEGGESGEGQFGHGRRKPANTSTNSPNFSPSHSNRLRAKQLDNFLSSGIIEVKHTRIPAFSWPRNKRRIPVTIHLAIGTDIPHMHPAASGRGTWRCHASRLSDWFCALVQQMHPGGVYLNWGSAVPAARSFF